MSSPHVMMSLMPEDLAAADDSAAFSGCAA